mmetsp:Transcript_48333/g.89621  ORF Transcript_48333/g.89621 Transcript_48333/m.89621 type:complete len:278 (+) Transcript_48333:273-1106(+)
MEGQRAYTPIRCQRQHKKCSICGRQVKQAMRLSMTCVFLSSRRFVHGTCAPQQLATLSKHRVPAVHLQSLAAAKQRNYKPASSASSFLNSSASSFCNSGSLALGTAGRLMLGFFVAGCFSSSSSTSPASSSSSSASKSSSSARRGSTGWAMASLISLAISISSRMSSIMSSTFSIPTSCRIFFMAVVPDFMAENVLAFWEADSRLNTCVSSVIFTFWILSSSCSYNFFLFSAYMAPFLSFLAIFSFASLTMPSIFLWMCSSRFSCVEIASLSFTIVA